MRICEDLELNVAGVLDELLHVEIAIPECCGGLTLCSVVEIGKFLSGADDSHAAATATSGGFHNDGKTNLGGPFDSFLYGADHTIRAGQNGYARLLHGHA